jgi:hypothetical protein
MKHNGLIVIILVIVLLSLSCASKGDPVAKYDAETLLKDFDQFRTIIEKKTARLYSDKEVLRNMLDSAESGINKDMSELEFYRLLAPIVAELRCGHSFLSVSKVTEDFMRTEAEFFPLDVRIMEDRLYVISDPYHSGVTPGTEIISINDVSARSIIDTIISNMPTDGQDTGRPRYDAERWFASMYYIFVGNSGRFDLLLADSLNERKFRKSINAIQDSTLAKTSMGIIHDTTDSPWSMSIEEGKAFAKIPTFSFSNPKIFRDEVSTFFKEIRRNDTEILILDLRGNYGGTPQPTVELFRYLINKPQPFFAENNPFYLSKWKKPVEPAQNAFDGQFYILMDEACFSMTSFLLSLIKYHDRGILFGTPSSGGYMCSDASFNRVLPNTGLRLRYSTTVFSTHVEGMEKGVGIQPDIPIEWTIEDYISGKDPVMAALLQYIG